MCPHHLVVPSDSGSSSDSSDGSDSEEGGESSSFETSEAVAQSASELLAEQNKLKKELFELIKVNEMLSDEVKWGKQVRTRISIVLCCSWQEIRKLLYSDQYKRAIASKCLLQGLQSEYRGITPFGQG